MAMRAIETTYQGYRFRSRLEARWAVFFNALGVAWVYEEQGFALRSGLYLPDFFLPEYRLYVEIKPIGAGDETASALCRDLAQESGADVALMLGVPDNGVLWVRSCETVISSTVEIEYVEGRGLTFIAEASAFDDSAMAGRPIASVWVTTLCPRSWARRRDGGIKSDAVREALCKAKGARFEHGEVPVL